MRIECVNVNCKEWKKEIIDTKQSKKIYKKMQRNITIRKSTTVVDQTYKNLLSKSMIKL